MGEKFLSGDNLNPKGYFEDLDFLNLNKYLLAVSGGDWRHIPAYEKIMALKNNKRACQLIQGLVSKRTQKYDMWGWKDPRTVLTIELFLPYLPETYIFSSFRNPGSIAGSLARGHNISGNDAYAMAIEYNKRLLAFLQKMNEPGSKMWPK